MLHRSILVIFITLRLIAASDDFDNGNLENFNRIDAATRDVDENLLEDSLLLVPGLVKKYGYPVEVHEVTTDDGYILEMHRLPRPGATPVLLVHGLLDSSSTWVIMGPKKGFAYILYDQGYDVWMANVRGNRYSRKHKVYTVEDIDFWKFSFHEIGKFDIPKMVDHVLEETGYEKLHYVAHSQGTTVFWIMCSEKPQYNNKILSMNAMAPIAYIKHCKSPVVLLMKTFLNSISALIKLIGMNEFLPNSEFITLIGNLFCKDETISQAICTNIIFLVVGFNKHQFNETMLPVVLGHTPAGASSKQILHFVQLAKSGYFRQYDYGMLKNWSKYRSFKPPKYDLSKVTAKVALHYSTNDWMSNSRDVEKLHQELGNPIGKFLVGDKNFNHLDFVWGIDAKEFLYDRIINILKYFDSEFL